MSEEPALAQRDDVYANLRGEVDTHMLSSNVFFDSRKKSRPTSYNIRS